MTATEASLRQAEKVMQFSPTFSRLTSEYLDPKLRRIFSILWRQGKMPQAPDEIQMVTQDQNVVVPVPNIAYNNRISLAIKSQQNSSYAEFMAMNQSTVEMQPEILDNLNGDVHFRESWRNAGLPEDGLRSQEEVDETRQARAEQQAQQAQMEQAMQATAMLKDASAANGGEVPAEVSEAMQQQ